MIAAFKDLLQYTITSNCGTSCRRYSKAYFINNNSTILKQCALLTWFFELTSAFASINFAATPAWPFSDAKWSGEFPALGTREKRGIKKLKWSGDHPLFRNEGEVAIKTRYTKYMFLVNLITRVQLVRTHTKTTDTLPLQRWNVQIAQCLLWLKGFFCLVFIYFKLNPDAEWSHVFHICLPIAHWSSENRQCTITSNRHAR